MTTINAIRYSDGRTVYNCRNYPYAPTNPKLGSPYQANTITWNPNTRVTTFSQPRQAQYDEYVTTTRTTPLGGTYPTTNQQSPYFTSLKKTESSDNYGRSAVTLSERPKQQTIVSRYLIDSLSIKCSPKIAVDCTSSKAAS